MVVDCLLQQHELELNMGVCMGYVRVNTLHSHPDWQNNPGIPSYPQESIGFGIKTA